MYGISPPHFSIISQTSCPKVGTLNKNSESLKYTNNVEGSN